MAPRSRKRDDEATDDAEPPRAADTPERPEDVAIIKEAKAFYTSAMAYEGYFRPMFTNDVRFVNADPDNHAQWPDSVYEQRTSDTNRRPTMTANVVAPVANFIINNTRMNLPSIVVKPTGDQSTFKSAEVREALIRHIQYRSQAPAIYVDAHTYQVWGGVGYFRINTRYDEENPDNDASAWDQSIFIDPVQSHMGVLLDPNIKQKSGSDARKGMIFEDVDRAKFELDYPGMEAPAYNAMDKTDDWVRENTVRVCEYYRIKSTPDEMIFIEDKDEKGQPTQSIFRRSDAPGNIDKAVTAAEKNGAKVKRRKVWDKRLQWFKIVGNKVVDKNLRLPGRGNYIPIVRVLGREVIVNGRMDRKGVIRNLKDLQRLLNYYLSTDAEYNALQPKSPFIGYKESFEGYETKWNALNTSNPPYLPANMVSEEIEGPIPLPQRQQGPTDAPAYRNGMTMALQQIALVSGIPDANMGRTTNEQSGLAVKERRRGGDLTNYDFADALAEAVEYAGRIINEWIPDVYDTERTIKVMARDGTQSEITIQPEQKEALMMEKVQEQENVERALFNPSVGKYEVVSEAGPSYATQREEAWEAFNGVVTRSPELMAIFGDLMFRTADFPLADKIAERFNRQIKETAPWLLGDAPGPLAQQQDQAIKQLQGVAQALMEELGKAQRKLEDKDRDLARKEAEAQSRAQIDDRKADTGEQDAISKRITAVTNAQLDLGREGMEGTFRKLLADTLDMADSTEFDPEAFGAKQAPDGRHYINDPERPGKFLRVG